MRIAALLLLLTGASAGLTACRLGANNSEKLSALKSGEIYDEDGLLTVSITSPSADTLINVSSSSENYSASGTCSPDGAEISVLIDGAADSSHAPVACSGGTWTSSFDSTALSDGAHSLTASIVRNGKAKSSSAVSFTKDVAVPLLAIVSPVNGGYVNSTTDSATFPISGTCDDSGQTATISVDGAAAASQVGGSCNGSTWAATFSTLPLPAGAHTLQVSIVNASGNSKSSDPVVVTKDLTAPTVSISAPSASSYVNLGNNSANFAVSGNCNDASANVQVQVDGNDSGTAAPCSGTNWNTTISTVGLAQGAHTLVGRITDAAGNAASSAAVTVTKDTVAPSIAITAPAASSFINLGNNSASFAIQGSCTTATESGRAVTIQVDGANATQSAISCGASNAWSGTFSTTALSQGAHTLTAILSDAAGNSTTSTPVAVTKDTSAPTITLSVPATGSIINPMNHSSTYRVQGTCSENSSAVSILVDGATASGLASNTCSSGAFSATIDVTGLSSATHTITATQTDAAGNTGPATPPSSVVSKDLTLAMGGTFSRASVAYDPVTAVQAASGVARYTTISGSTGLMLEEGATNLLHVGTGAGSNLASWQQLQTGTTVAEGDWYRVTGGATASTLRGYVDLAQLTNLIYYTVSIEAYNDGASPVTIILDWCDEYSSHTLAAGEKKRISGTHTKSIGYSNTYRFMDVYIAGGNSILLRNPQVERQDYATSYVNGTRAAEVLTMSPAGSIQASQGAIVFRAYVAGDLASLTPKLNHYLFGHSDGSSYNRIFLRQLNGGNLWSFNLRDGSGTNVDITTPLTSANTSVGWHTFAGRWSATEASLWIDGQKVNSTSNPPLPTTLQPNAGIGSLGSGQQWNQPIDYAAFYQYAPSDTEMQSIMANGPSNADNRLDFGGVTFTRSSVAQNYNSGTQAASGVPRYGTVNGRTGLLIEEPSSNLLTANQSDAETNLSGIVNNTGTSIAQTTETAWQGSSSVLATVTVGGAHRGNYYNVPKTTVVAGNVYTFSVYAKKKAGGTINLYPGIEWWTSGGTSFISRVTGSTVTLTSDWTRITYTATAPATADAAIPILYTGNSVTTSESWYVDGAQFEQKPYATTWTVGGGTRAEELLAVPVSGNFTPGDWTIAMDYIPTTTQDSKAIHGRLWYLFIDTNNLYSIRVGATTGKATLHTISGGTEYTTSATGLPTMVPGTTYRIVAKGKNGSMALWVNNVKGGNADVSYTEPVGTLPSKMQIHSYPTTLGQPNGLLDALYLFNAAPTDAVIEAWGAEGAVTGAGLKLDFNNSLGQ